MIQVFGYQITLLQVLFVVFGIGLLVFIHELGHFITAKLYKLKVELFAFGFGPELIGFTYGETRYSICLFPLGGMVKLPGEDLDSSTGSPDEFLSQPWYKRMTIALAGPLMNYALAAVFFASVVYFWGISKPVTAAVIGQVIEGKPAAQAGLKEGDKIVRIGDTPINSWEEMASIIYKRPEVRVEILVERGGKLKQYSLKTIKDPRSGYGLIGIAPQFTMEKYGVLGSLKLGAQLTWLQTYYTLKYLWLKLVEWEKPELAGPIGVIQVLAKAAKMGLANMLYLLGVISTALGLFNLLPIPLVDGGHIFMALFEFATKKPLNKKTIYVANFVGLGIIIFIFIFATYSDISRIIIDIKQ